MKDSFGFEIEGYDEATTIQGKIDALEKHKEIIEGLSNEAISTLENEIYKHKQNL